MIEDFGIMHWRWSTAIEKQHPSMYGAVFLAILIPLYYVSWQYHTAHAPRGRTTRPPSTDSVAEWLDVHLIEAFNPSAIEAYCNTTEWRPNLVFNLDNANGGVGKESSVTPLKNHALTNPIWNYIRECARQHP